MHENSNGTKKLIFPMTDREGNEGTDEYAVA